MRGRYPAGPEAALQLAGSKQARQRLRVILQLLAGQLRVHEACVRLGVGATRLEQLRRRALQAAVEALEPRPGGRPRSQQQPQLTHIAELEARVLELERELALSRAREELASIPQRAEKKR